VPRTLRLVVASVLIAAALAAAGCADQPVIWFENQRDEPVSISIDGDRLVVLQPRATEYLPYSTAAWAWPRRVEVSTRSGTPLWSAHFDADDLAQARWRIYVRP
jgi:hypothetical protein